MSKRRQRTKKPHARAAVNASDAVPVMTDAHAADSTRDDQHSGGAPDVPWRESAGEAIVMPEGATADDAMIAFGERLRHGREEMRWSTLDVAARLHLPEHVIVKLEQGRWNALGGRVYLQGYLRSYCGLLQIAEPTDVDCAEPARQAAPQLMSPKPLHRHRRTMQRAVAAATYLAITAIIVVPIIVLGINGHVAERATDLVPNSSPDLANFGEAADARAPDSRKTSRSEQPLMASMAPLNLLESGDADARAPAADPAVEPDVAAANNDGGLTIKLKAPCWVEVRAADGTHLEYALLQPGEYHYPRDGALTVRLGNVGAAEVSRGTEDLDLQSFVHANVAFFRVAASGELTEPADG